MPVIVVTGISGSGKSVIGSQLSTKLNVPFCESDDLHPAANITKMEMGTPLNDADRAPWLARVACWIKDHPTGGVVACSALRQRYRHQLREGQPVLPLMVLLNPPRAVVKCRLEGRKGHFMPARLLDSQLSTLEMPSLDEEMLILNTTEQAGILVDKIITWFQRE